MTSAEFAEIEIGASGSQSVTASQNDENVRRHCCRSSAVPQHGILRAGLSFDGRQAGL